MSSVQYLQGRKKYSRPQALLFSNNSGVVQLLDEGTPQERTVHVPLGNDVLANAAEGSSDFQNFFMILSDDNRGELDFKVDRIEKRERMVNGRMRSYHIADKLSLSVSWNNLPSRSAARFPDYLPNGTSSLTREESYTTDGGAGGVELLEWYETNPGSFWVYLSYDKYNQNGLLATQQERANTLRRYNQVVEMFFSDFSYSVVKRGGSNYDFWNISFTLEEV
jgi:hypothetical protein